MINARNSTYYFDAENKCKNENSILVSTLEPEFSPLYVKKLKEYDKKMILNIKFEIVFCYHSKSSKTIFGDRYIKFCFIYDISHPFVG